MGLSPYADVMKSECVYVNLPSVGSKLKAGESCGLVESVGGVTEIYHAN